MSFKDRLKEARLSSGLTQEQLANEIGVAKSTLTGYEKGNREPDMAKIAKIIETLNVSADFLFQDDLQNLTELVITLDERKHITKYRSLDPLDKKAVDGLLDTLSEREKPIIKEQSQDTEQSKEFIVLEPPKIIPCYPKLASAGTGEYVFNDIPMDMIETDNCDADFALGVNGVLVLFLHSFINLLIIKKSTLGHIVKRCEYYGQYYYIIFLNKINYFFDFFSKKAPTSHIER